MIFASNIQTPEGPVSLPDGSWLVVEMSEERGCVTHLSPDGQHRRALAKTGRPNGLAVDRSAAIWVAETMRPALLRMQMDGSYETILTACGDQPFLFPNDLAFGPDGWLYMTDSGILVGDFGDDYATAAYDGRVYRIHPQTREIQVFDRGIRFTNGIAFGPDGYLYVNETMSGDVFRYRWSPGGMGPREPFANVIDPHAAPGYKGPDGMKFGADGNLYVTVYGQQDVTELGRGGEVLRRIRLAGKCPTNLAFGPAREKKIYVTEVTLNVLEALDVDTPGLPLYQG